MNSIRKNQTGVALIVILLIVATVAALATQMHWQHRISMRRVENQVTQQQAYQYAIGGENWAREILVADLRDTTTDHLSEEWASSLPPLPIDGGAIQGRIIDLQGRFNLNSIIDENGKTQADRVEQFQRLLQALEIDPSIAAAVADWLDSDNYPEFPGGAEDETYSALDKPYKTANHFITDVTELMSIKGFNKAIFEQLKPHISTLPIRKGLNVNTATPIVLQSLSNDLNPAIVEEILDQRAQGAFENINEFFTLTNLQPEVVTASLDTQSEYFLLEIDVNLQNRLYRRHTYLFRDLQAGTVSSYQRIHSPNPLPIIENNEADFLNNSDGISRN